MHALFTELNFNLSMQQVRSENLLFYFVLPFFCWKGMKVHELSAFSSRCTLWTLEELWKDCWAEQFLFLKYDLTNTMSKERWLRNNSVLCNQKRFRGISHVNLFLPKWILSMMVASANVNNLRHTHLIPTMTSHVCPNVCLPIIEHYANPSNRTVLRISNALHEHLSVFVQFLG